MEKEKEQYGLHIADYIIYLLTLCTSLGIGFYYGCIKRKAQTSTSEYLVGGRKLKIIPVMVSLVITFESSLSILGYPSEAYIHGIEYMVWDIVPFGIFLIVTGVLISVPLFHPLKLTSVYEYLELRYNHRAPRYLGSLVGMFYYVIYAGTNIYGPSLALAAVTDIPMWVSLLVISCVAVIYTSIGGIRTVVWTDLLQFSIVILSMSILAIMVIIEVGGLTKTWDINEKYLRTRAFKFDFDPTIRHTVWSLGAVGMFRFHHMAYNQATVQRICSVPTRREAYIVMIMTGPLFTLLILPQLFECIGIFAFFNQIRCDPLQSGQIDTPNEIALYASMLIFKNLPGMTGLFIASMSSASLSTISSGLNSNSAQIVEDFIKPLKKNISDRKLLIIAKISVVCFGLCALALAFLASIIKGSLLQVALSLMHCAGGPISGLFLYSILCPWATSKGAIVGTLTSMLFVSWMALGQSFSPDILTEPWLPMNPVDNCFKGNSSIHLNFTKVSINNIDTDFSFQNATLQYWKDMELYKNQELPGIKKLYTVSYSLFSTIAIFVNIVVASVVSFVTGYPPPNEVDTRYMLPIGDVLFPYLPRKWTKCLDFGLDFQKRRDWLQTIDKTEADETEVEPLQTDAANERKGDKTTAY